MRAAATICVVFLAACSDGAEDAPARPAVAADVPEPVRPTPARRARVRAEAAPEAPGVVPAGGTSAPTAVPEFDVEIASTPLYTSVVASAEAPAAAETPLTPENLGERLRAAARSAGPQSAAVALVVAIERDPALVRAAAELLASTQDEDVCAALHDGLRQRYISQAWWPERAALNRAAEAPGPAARRAAAFWAMGFGEGFRAVAGGGTDPDTRAALFRRAAIETDPQVVMGIGVCLGYGKLSAEERAVLFECAKRLDVPFDPATPARHPARSARRVLYEDLGSDALLRDDWSEMLARIGTAPTQNERDDVTAGFILACDYINGPGAGAAGTAERAAALASRREVFSRFYRAANGLTDRADSCRRPARSLASSRLRPRPRTSAAPPPRCCAT